MTWNLLLWEWSPEFDTPAKRRKSKLKFADITAQFARTSDHPAIGVADIKAFCSAIDAEFGIDEDVRPFVLEDYGKCAVINYPNAVRIELVPRIYEIGRAFGLNASEF